MGREEWRSYTVLQLVDKGMLEKPFDGNHGAIHPKASDYVPVGIPFIMANDLVEGKVAYNSCHFISCSQASSLKKGFAKPGDVLLTHKATIGRTAIVGIEYPSIILTPQVTYYRVKKGINNRYLKYYFDSDPFQQLFQSWSGAGSTRAYLGITEQLKLPIVLPSLAEQNSIAAILSSLDDKIELNNRIIANLEAQAQAIFKSWFVDFEPFSGEAPTSWLITTLDSLCSLVSRGITPKYSEDATQIVINQKCIRNHKIDLGESRSHTPVAKNEKWLQYGDIVINSTGQGTLGRVAQFFFSADNITADSHVTIVRPKKRNLTSYLGQWIISKEDEIESMAAGSTGQTELSRERVKAMTLFEPDNSVLDAFADIIEPMTEMIQKKQEENASLALTRDTLLPKLMSGEIEVMVEG